MCNAFSTPDFFEDAADNSSEAVRLFSDDGSINPRIIGDNSRNRPGMVARLDFDEGESYLRECSASLSSRRRKKPFPIRPDGISVYNVWEQREIFRCFPREMPRKERIRRIELHLTDDGSGFAEREKHQGERHLPAFCSALTLRRKSRFSSLLDRGMVLFAGRRTSTFSAVVSAAREHIRANRHFREVINSTLPHAVFRIKPPTEGN